MAGSVLDTWDLAVKTEGKSLPLWSFHSVRDGREKKIFTPVLGDKYTW